MISQLFVSVVVPTYNRRASLQRLLDALTAQTYAANSFEVIVVDDGSSDDTVEFVRQYPAPYAMRLVEQAHAGPAAARNKGVAAARGTLIVFLDDDVEPVPALIDQHVMSHSVEHDAVVIGPMSPPRGWPRPVWVRWEERQLESQYRAMLTGLWDCTARQFYTGNASLARAHFLQVGGFDTSFKRAEDVELGYRLDDAGLRFIFNPRADTLHYANRTFESWCRTPYQYGRYDVIMQRDKSRHTLDWALKEFGNRKLLNRTLVGMCVGRPCMAKACISILGATMRVASAAGAIRAAELTLSGIFSVLYWQGICDELGNRSALKRALELAATPS